jgi:hypothetical protein
LGGALYEEPHVETKQLLQRQCDLETKRQQEKSFYKLAVGTKIARSKELTDNPDLREAKRELDKLLYEMWRKEYYASMNYVMISTDNSMVFTHKSYPESPRLLLNGQRCTCKIRNQYYMQCRHEILLHEGVFRVDLIGKRNFFHPKVLQVKRGCNVAGDVLVATSTNLIKMNMSTLPSTTEKDILVLPLSTYESGEVISGRTNEVPINEEPLCTQTPRKQKKVTHNEVMNVFKDIARMAESESTGTLR